MHATYPHTRMRRLRQADWIRTLVRETSVSVKDLIWPAFVIEGQKQKQPIASMPGVDRYTIDLLVEKAKFASDVGIGVIALFPHTDPSLKSDEASEALNPENLVCRATQAIKKACPNIGVMCDVALDPYTSHGHDGLLKDGVIVNDETLEVLVKQALNQAQAGCNILGPSDMMDGRVGAIRKALENANFQDTLIMAYSAKYASSFYGPFREAVGSSASLQGDKKTYQQSPANIDEAIREVSLDLQEGADMVMVKPGMPYLDVIAKVKETFKVPTFAYQVSGEYAMLMTAAQKGYLDQNNAFIESMHCFKRSGADGILTYAALDLAQQLR